MRSEHGKGGPARRVTLADIARRAGVSTATVSLALRNDRQISEKTRRRIHALAKRMGYAPNPLVSALMAQVHGRRVQSEAPALAYLNPTHVSPHERNFPTMQRYWNGARARAERLGYRLEEFWLLEPGMTPARMDKILRARGIAGLVLAPPDPEITDIRMDWRHYAVSSIDHVLSFPDVHWACANHFQGMWLALENLERLGYERIGLALSRAADVRVMHAWVSAFAGRQALRTATLRPPIYLAEDWTAGDRERFPAWVRECRVDALICSEPGPIEILAERGYRVPDQIGLAHMAVECAGMACAGIDQNSELVGAAAVDIVVGLLHRNERGASTPSRAVMVEGRWVDGLTVRAADASSAGPIQPSSVAT